MLALLTLATASAYLPYAAVHHAKWDYFTCYFIPAVLVVLFLAARGVPLGAEGDIALPSSLADPSAHAG